MCFFAYLSRPKTVLSQSRSPIPLPRGEVGLRQDLPCLPTPRPHVRVDRCRRRDHLVPHLPGQPAPMSSWVVNPLCRQHLRDRKLNQNDWAPTDLCTFPAPRVETDHSSGLGRLLRAEDVDGKQSENPAVSGPPP